MAAIKTRRRTYGATRTNSLPAEGRCTTCDATGRVLACGCRRPECDQCERGDLDICPDCIDGIVPSGV